MALNENPTLVQVVDEIDRLNKLIVDRGGAKTITPKTTNQVLAKGNYKGDITIKGDANLKPENILSGKSIFGVSGTVTSGEKVVASNSTKEYIYRFRYDNDYLTHNPNHVHFNRRINVNGSIRLYLKFSSDSSNGTCVIRCEVIRNGATISAKDFSSSNTKPVEFTYDMNINSNDTVKLWTPTYFGRLYFAEFRYDYL